MFADPKLGTRRGLGADCGELQRPVARINWLFRTGASETCPSLENSALVRAQSRAATAGCGIEGQHLIMTR